MGRPHGITAAIRVSTSDQRSCYSYANETAKRGGCKGFCPPAGEGAPVRGLLFDLELPSPAEARQRSSSINAACPLTSPTDKLFTALKHPRVIDGALRVG